MSFVRVGRPQQPSRGKRSIRPKKAAATKREWVSTVNDLSVHKLTPAELSHRHEIHKSHNKVVAQWELKEKALKRRLRITGSTAPVDQASLSIIREVFSDQLLLHDVLARSDRAMAVVKDLFGDAPRRQTGHPSVTMAPNCDSDSELLVLQKPDPPTHLSLLSQSMMDQEALNELEASGEDHTDKNSLPFGSPETHVIQRANLRTMKTRSRGRVMQQQKDHHSNYHHGDSDNVPVTPSTSGEAPDQTALNATVAVQRVRAKQSQSEDSKDETSALVSQVLNPDLPLLQSGTISSHNDRPRKCVSQSSELSGSSAASVRGDQSSLGLLQAMLGQVEADLDALSPDAIPASPQIPKQQSSQGFTGFSVAFVSTLGRLVHLLKQREDDAQGAADERKRLKEELTEQRRLIDALTAETMTLREEALALHIGLQQQTAELEQKLDTVVLVMGGLGLLGEHSGASQVSDVSAEVCQSAPVPEQTQVSVSPAVLLSPPWQGDNRKQIPVTHPVPMHQQLPPVDFLRSCKDIQAHGSASSLSSLQLPRPPSSSSPSLSSDSLRSQFSPGAILAEIAQLSKQNELIKVQLSQAKDLVSGAGGSVSSSSKKGRSSPSSTRRITPQSAVERRISESSSTGRVTPQSAGERMMPESGRTGRQSQHIHSPEEPLIRQTTSLNSLGVNSVEQRLLELNRQSAAARGQLLQLIEQQKQSISVRVSPSVSPIPPSAFSPNTAAEGGSLEGSMLLPEQDCQSHAGSERRFGKETSEGQTQLNKQRGQEGWFALSAHMR